MGKAVGVDLRLDIPVRPLQRLGLERVGRRETEKFEVILQTLNDSPQPHSSLTFGLLNLKPSFSPSRV